jgi:hypothetical protein
MTTQQGAASAAPTHHAQIVQRRRLKQKWHAKFVADNNLTLAHTENYANRADLENMLDKYFPDWPIRQ